MRLLEAVEDADSDTPLGCPGEPVNPCPQPIENLDKTTGSPIGPVIPSAVEPQGLGSGGDPVQIIENIEGGHRVTGWARARDMAARRLQVGGLLPTCEHAPAGGTLRWIRSGSDQRCGP